MKRDDFNCLTLWVFFQLEKLQLVEFVDIVDSVGVGIMVVSTLSAIISAGGTAIASATIDLAIITIKDYLNRNLKAKAITY